MSNKWVKIGVWSAGALLGLFIIFSVAVWLFLPADKIKSIAEEGISETTGRQCTIEGLGVSLWRGLALDLSGVTLAAGEGEDVPHTANLDHLYLKMKLLPLLSRRVEIVSLILAGPEIYIVRDKSGELNLSKLIPADEETEEEPSAGEALNLLLLKVVLEDAVVHYHDQLDSTRVTLGGIEGELNMKPGANDLLPIDGVLKVDELREAYPGELQKYEAALPVIARFEGSTAIDWSVIELTKVTFIAGGVQLDGPLALDFSNPDSLNMKTSMTGGADDPERLSNLILPESFPRRIDRLEIALEADGSELKLNSLELGMGQDKLSLSGSVSLAEPYSARGNLKADLSLEGLKDFVESGEVSWSGSGQLTADLNVEADLDDPLKSWRASGIVNASTIRVALPEGLPELSLSALSLKLKGRDLERASVTVTAGSSKLESNVSVKNWPGLLPPGSPMASGRARWQLEAKADNLDLVELLGEDYYGAGEEEKTIADTSSLPMSLGDGRGSLTVRKLVVSEGVALEDAGVWLTVKDSLLTVDSLAAVFFGGRISGTGAFVLAAAGLGSWEMDVRADQVQAGAMMSPFSDIGQYLSGLLSTDIKLKQGSSSVDQLNGLANFSLTGGALRDWPALNEISNMTNIAELKDLNIDDWIGKFELREGRVFGDDLNLKTAAGLIGASGSVGLDGSLDYKLTLALNERLSNKYRGKLPGEIGKFLTGDGGQLELGFKLGGTTDSPSVKMDMTPIKKRVQSQLMNQAEKLIDRLIPNKGTSGDSAAGDSTKDAAKESLKGLFKNLLKKN